MSSRNLTPVSYVVLGLIARDGPSTPYEVKAAVARGIAHFWPFPHSQIYSETEYLTGLRLLAEERERSGRRRRTFRVTDAGRRVLESWLCEPTSDAFQIRSYAFLKLYFGYFARPEDVLNLAGVQIASLETQLTEIGQMLDRLKVRADRKWQLALGEMFSDLSRAVLDAWKRVEARASHEARASTAAVRRPNQRTSLSAAMRRQKRRRAG
jgi:PadR family transcriptional regulator AphA